MTDVSEHCKEDEPLFVLQQLTATISPSDRFMVRTRPRLLRA